MFPTLISIVLRQPEINSIDLSNVVPRNGEILRLDISMNQIFLMESLFFYYLTIPFNLSNN